MRLVVADEAHKRARDPLTHPEWGARLSLEAYLERERRLRDHPWARAGMTTWLWADEGGGVLASCETFRMRSFLPSGQEGVTFGVASVYTEPSLRGRGHATAMMRALVERLRREPDAHASILFSDVGAPLYQRAGYVARPALERVYQPLPGAPGDAADALYSEDEVPAALEALPRPSGFVVWPSAAQLDWHLERERIYAGELRVPRPECAGARVGRSTALWVATLKEGTLLVLLLDARDPDEALGLMRCACKVAHGAGLIEVRVWSPDLDGGALRERRGELPMIAPLHPRVDPEDWREIPRALWT